MLDKESLLAAREKILAEYRQVDILLNAARGNVSGAIVFGDLTFFKMTHDAYEQAIALNLTGALLPSQMFGEAMVEQKSGVIICISSMTAQKPLTPLVGYGNAKAAVDSFTKWPAIELAHKYGLGLRVNAIAPSFFIGD